MVKALEVDAREKIKESSRYIRKDTVIHLLRCLEEGGRWAVLFLEHQVWKSLLYNLAYPSPKLQLQTMLRLESTDSSKAQRVGKVGEPAQEGSLPLAIWLLPWWVDYITQCLF